ncbi:membrane bound lytic murein transglycosylase [Legionella moravica]|uniref:Membrane bound lytic murein transglycosylase n=1 Tax=Legionella moravica TaxID=39962 RepID=A0A378JWH6_9GAMM|nr:lytic murein transglycosylase B [Legionella moravica]KTD32270.1 membrane bound lytic murein transglycosylase [Legionella moravica]STX62367.1 membrane bound lytic murein transglycosylase [Legionella moravica]
MRRLIWLGYTLLFLVSCTSYADTAFTQRQDVQNFINSMVKNHQFNRKQLTETMNQVVLQPQIIESMEKPYEKKTWDVYKGLFLTPQRVKGGLDFWAANKKDLDRAQKRYGVPPEIIIAILGVETLYGERQGDYRVLDALATLAFNYPKRSPFFTKELTEYLLLCREHKVPATHHKGSYAGAIGKPQFMPSSYRYYAVDFNNKGHRDLVTNNADAIGSIANYLHKHGWRLNGGIAQPAKISGWKYKRIQMNPKTANYNFAQLEAAGIKPVTASLHHPARAGVIELLTNEGKEYWLAYPNFFVITRYNSSPQYAMAVYLLSQQLKQHWVAQNTKKHRAYV